MGGCVSNQQEFSEAHPNIFYAINIDENNKKRNPGHLEVSETTIYFHQKGKPSTEWPLKCLRRYGAEGEKFSFESGRRCKSGPGIYVFRCTKADRLLALLQERVRSNSATHRTAQDRRSFGEENHAQPPDLIRHQSLDSLQPRASRGGNNDPSFTSPVNTTMTASHTARSRLGSLPSAQQAAPATPLTPTGPALAGAGNHFDPDNENEAVSATLVLPSLPEYENVNCNGGPIEASDGYLVPNTPVRLHFNGGGGNVFDSQREYENVVTDINRSPKSSVGDANGAAVFASSSITTNHHLLSLRQQQPILPPKDTNGVLSNSESAPPGSHQQQPESPQINYIAVDFEQPPSSQPGQPLTLRKLTASSSSSSSALPPATELRGEYCTIDIDRTKALSTTAQQQSQREPGSSDSPKGVRKTRHNSTLSELTACAGGGKRNSVIGD